MWHHNLIIGAVALAVLVCGFFFGLLVLGKSEDAAIARALRERDEDKFPIDYTKTKYRCPPENNCAYCKRAATDSAIDEILR